MVPFFSNLQKEVSHNIIAMKIKQHQMLSSEFIWKRLNIINISHVSEDSLLEIVLGLESFTSHISLLQCLSTEPPPVTAQNEKPCPVVTEADQLMPSRREISGCPPFPGCQWPPRWHDMSKVWESRTKPSFVTIAGKEDNPIHMIDVHLPTDNNTCFLFMDELKLSHVNPAVGFAKDDERAYFGKSHQKPPVIFWEPLALLPSCQSNGKSCEGLIMVSYRP